MISSYDLLIEFIFVASGIFCTLCLLEPKRGNLCKKNFVHHQKKKVCATKEKEQAFCFLSFFGLFVNHCFIHQWSKYDTVQKFFSFLVFLASLWTHDFLHHFYQINYMFFMFFFLL